MIAGQRSAGLWLAALLPLLPHALQAAEPIASEAAAPVANEEVLEEVYISAPEPRYVAPTRRDQIGRIWAPVYINDKGPFRLVLDTGATHSAVMRSVADALQLPLSTSSSVMLRGATGSAVVPTIKVDSLRVGELLQNNKNLPIVTNALGGAQGILGTEGFGDKRIYIDFRSDLIVINKSRRQPAPAGFVTLPVKFTRGRLLQVDAHIGGLPVKAIIDTGGQATIANVATREALKRRLSQRTKSTDRIVGATEEEVVGEGYRTPSLVMGDVEVQTGRMTFLDLEIFKVWRMLDEPAVLIGMDVLGSLDTLIIDYQRAELQMLLHNRRPSLF